MPFISQETLMARNANPPTTIEEERAFWDRHIAEMDERYAQELEQETRLLRIRLETIRRGVSDKRKLLDYLNRRIGL
jgi:recombinational DNA repair ATPase RecF